MHRNKNGRSIGTAVDILLPYELARSPIQDTVPLDDGSTTTGVPTPTRE